MTQLSLSDFNGTGDEQATDETTCPTCGRDDFASHRGVKSHHKQAHGESIAGVRITCAHCGETDRKKPHEVADAERNYCSPACHNADEANSVTFTCEWCGEKRTRSVSSTAGRERLFCGQDCKAAWDSERMRGANSPLWQGGRTTTVECAYCGNPKEVYQYRAEEYERHFCNARCRGDWFSENQRGQAHPDWRGGHALRPALVATLPGPPWERQRQRALERAGHECRVCGTEEGLDVHHIVPVLAGGTNGLWNLMVLCKRHHGLAEEVADDYATYTLRGLS